MISVDTFNFIINFIINIKIVNNDISYFIDKRELHKKVT